MNFNDIFKSSFLENITSVSVVDMLLTLALAFGIGLFIFLVYKKTYSGVMYSSSFGGTAGHAPAGHLFPALPELFPGKRNDWRCQGLSLR